MRSFEYELAELRRSLVAMGTTVETATQQAVEALIHPVTEARENAKIIDDQLDEMHTTLENRLHTLLALQTPKVGDLRLAVSSLRIISVFEQMGDLAEGVAKRASYIARHKLVDNPQQLSSLCSLVVSMIHESVEAYVGGSIDLARRLIAEEKNSDELTKSCYSAIQDAMAAQPELIKEYTHLLRAVSNLEYIGDLAVVIAEEAVFIHQGRMVRHNLETL